MVSASALRANCGHPRFLSKLHPPSANSQAAMDKGNLFHAACELWIKTGDLAHVLAGLLDDEVRGWVELLAMTWAPRDGMECEKALGLGTDGRYVPVTEPEPHVYVPIADDAHLLTAGRADLLWWDWRPLAPGVDVKVVTVKDWKSGRYQVTPARENLQLSALAFAAADAYGCAGFVREIYYARDGYLDADPAPVMLDSDEAAEAWDRVERAALLDDAPRPGSHCNGCWEKRTRRCEFAAKEAA